MRQDSDGNKIFFCGIINFFLFDKQSTFFCAPSSTVTEAIQLWQACQEGAFDFVNFFELRSTVELLFFIEKMVITVYNKSENLATLVVTRMSLISAKCSAKQSDFLWW